MNTTISILPLMSVWDSLVEVFGKMILALSINGQVGIGIILFTAMIRTVLLPLFQMQMKSSRKLQELQPQIKALQDRYPGKDADSQATLGQAMSQLYKDHDVKLSAAALPIFIQLPILLALYQALIKVEALKVGKFFWLNLGESDPYFILPILAAGLTFFSMWLSNKSVPEKTQMMTLMSYAMSAMIFIFALTAASGVALYWAVSNAYQVLQTLLLNNPFTIIAEREAKIKAEKDRQAKIRKAQKKAHKKK